jgi:adenylyl-sulfate kinase
MVIWITGMSAAGKTTLSKAFEKLYRPVMPNMVLLDGDVIRLMYGNDLGYAEEDRVTQIRRIQAIASFLEKQSIVVVVAALYARDDLLQHNRDTFEEYVEVYLKADLDLLKQREIKGLYQKAASKETQNVVGFDIPWNAPKNPNLTVDMSAGQTPEQVARTVYELAFGKQKAQA